MLGRVAKIQQGRMNAGLNSKEISHESLLGSLCASFIQLLFSVTFTHIVGI